jgi:hypothetical protein
MTTAESCSNRCIWKDAESQCLLHTPEQFEVGTKEVDAKGLLVKKLIEELIRFPTKRFELLQKKVSRYIRLREPFRSGNELIVPEDSAAWSELLRMEWAQTSIDQPKFLEEYTAIQAGTQAANEAANEVVEDKIALPFPELLVNFFDNPRFTASSTFYTSPSGSIIPLLEEYGVSFEELEELGQPPDLPVILPKKEVLEFVAQKTKMTLYQLIYEEDSPLEPQKSIVPVLYEETKKRADILFIVLLEDGNSGIVVIPNNMMPVKIQKEIARTPGVLYS